VFTPTHIHIAVANGLGWGFDGMDGVIFALASPLIIKDFGLSIPDYRSGLQIALLVGIAGMFVWPWLADRYGRRTLLAINIALFSLMMPILARRLGSGGSRPTMPGVNWTRLEPDGTEAKHGQRYSAGRVRLYECARGRVS
jgi:MFS family permease